MTYSQSRIYLESGHVTELMQMCTCLCYRLEEYHRSYISIYLCIQRLRQSLHYNHTISPNLTICSKGCLEGCRHPVGNDTVPFTTTILIWRNCVVEVKGRMSLLTGCLQLSRQPLLNTQQAALALMPLTTHPLF